MRQAKKRSLLRAVSPKQEQVPYTDALLAPSDAPLAYLGCAIMLDGLLKSWIRGRAHIMLAQRGGVTGSLTNVNRGRGGQSHVYVRRGYQGKDQKKMNF